MIKSPAILKDGKVYVGKDHESIIKEMVMNDILCDGLNYGFVTDSGEFVNRADAFDIALSCKQIIEPESDAPRMLTSRMLSEGIYEIGKTIV